MANTITEDQNKIAIDNGWDPMRNSAYSAVLEFSSDNLLDKIICGCINWSSRFIKHQNCCLFKQSLAQGNQLPLPNTPIISILEHCQFHIQYNWLISYKQPQKASTNIVDGRQSWCSKCVCTWRIKLLLFLADYIPKLRLIKCLYHIKTKYLVGAFCYCGHINKFRTFGTIIYQGIRQK